MPALSFAYLFARIMSDRAINKSLRSRALNAGGWVVTGQVVGAAVRLGGNLILTRLLVPEAFGLMAIVYVMMTGFLLFSDIGLGPNVTQSKRGEDPDFLNTVWAVQIARGTLVWLAAIALSICLYVAGQFQLLPDGSVYAHPLLPWVVAIYSATQFISGFYPTRLLTAGRRFSLGRVTQIEIGQQLIGLVAMLIWASFSPTIWALVGGTLITSVARLGLYRLFLPGKGNRWHWDADALREIIGFGKWVFISSIVGFLVMSGDRLLLGGMVDARQFGIYSIAFLIVSFPQITAGQLIGRVAFPALAEVVRKHPEGLRDMYYKFRLYFDLALLFISGFFVTFGAVLVQLLYDTRYEGAGPVIQILALSLITTRYLLADRCYMALGKPNLLTPLNLLRLLSLYVLVPVAFWLYGFKGALLAIALNECFCLPLVFYLKIREGLFDLKKELRVLPMFFVGATVGYLMLPLGEPLKLVGGSLKHMLH